MHCAHFSVAWSVCLSVVCHIYAPCLNRLTDLDAIQQVHLWGLMTHCVKWGSLPDAPGNGDLGSNPQPKHAAANYSHEELGGQRFRLLQNYFGPCYTHADNDDNDDDDEGNIK